MSEQQGSEVARLLEQIREEYEAAQRGLSGLALGTSQHAFITERYENIGKLNTEMQQFIPERDAWELIVNALQGNGEKPAQK